MRILAIGAHPDDLEFQCGGTLALLAQQGHSVTMAIATDGGIGHPSATCRSEVAEVRRIEAAKSASLIGADLIWMGLEDEWLFNDRQTRTAFIDAYRQARPDFVISHTTTDYHPDHNVTGQVAMDARMPASIRLLETRLPPTPTIAHFFMMDNQAGVDFVPDVYVDISAVHELKAEMLRCHASQQGWLDHFFGMEYVSAMEMKDRQRGAECGTEFAEGFCELKTFPITGDATMLPNAIKRS